jgi:hypothetical protein
MQLVNDELGNMWNEAAVAALNTNFVIFPWGVDKGMNTHRDVQPS